MNGRPNVLIGFTDDGKVFLATQSTLEGKPVQTAIHLDPNDALSIAEQIKDTVSRIRSKADGGNCENPH